MNHKQTFETHGMQVMRRDLNVAFMDLIAHKEQADNLIGQDNYWTTNGDPDGEPLHLEHMRLLRVMKSNIEDIGIMMRAMQRYVAAISADNFRQEGEMQQEAGQ